MLALESNALQRVVRRVTEFMFGRRPRHRPTLAVRYGGREFSAPQLLSEALLPSAPGCYAIQVRNWWGTMKPVHFGDCHDLREELSVDGPVWFVHLLSLYESRRGVFVSISADGELDHHKRQSERMRLNRHYFPHRTHSADEHLARHRIHRKNHGQST
jgi:hypothetical protein